MPYETLKNIAPREYQKQIYEVCKDKNCLVVLPTGIGKTLIALMLVINRQKAFPGKKCLFLAPTRPLAEQHLNYFKKNIPELFAQLEMFTGKIDAAKRKKLWQNADIIFSTPQCIANDIKHELYDLNDVSLLIEDECHRCLKNYAYTYVAERYKEQAENPRILGLTASPGAEKKTIEQIAKNLNIEAIELRTRESEDVKEYIQELNFEVIKLPFPLEFQKIRALLQTIFNRKAEELKSRKLLFAPPMKTFLLECQKKIMYSISQGNRNFNILSGASACAQAIKIQHALELLETQTLFGLQSYMYELFNQASKQQSKSVQHLVKYPEFNQAFILVNELIAKKQENPKILELKSIIEQEIKENPKTKIIVFAQFRDTVAKICKELNTIKGINARVFVGQTMKNLGQPTSEGKQEETGLSQKEQQTLIREFSSGEVNVIAATSIAEEGLDIPEVNAVIFYEPIPSAIRKIQRAGRTARLNKGKLLILMVEKTRDEAYYWSAFNKEKKMYKAIKSIKEDIDNGTFNANELDEEDKQEENPEKNEQENKKENPESKNFENEFDNKQKTLF